MQDNFLFSVRRVRINQGGYDNNGRYFGIGDKIYIAEAVDGPDTVTGWDWPEDIYTRCADREEAKRRVKKEYPNARFYR